MRLLAFDTSTDTMSVAVSRDDAGASGLWQHDAPGAAQASATLIAAIMDLMARAGLQFRQLDAIAFGRGPGAFTGLRTACSVAQGLGFATQSLADGNAVPVLAVDTLLALAEEARHQHAPGGEALRVLAMLDARMGEVYSAAYAYANGCWVQIQGCQVGRPENLALAPDWSGQGTLLAGNVFAAYADRLPLASGAPRVTALPSAAAMLRLAPALLVAGHGVSAELALPIYIRDKVAQTSLERAAAANAAPSAQTMTK